MTGFSNMVGGGGGGGSLSYVSLGAIWLLLF